jgi:thioredoxin 1
LTKNNHFSLENTPELCYDKRKTKEDVSMSILHVTKENYAQEVLGADKPVLLDFWATWCGPCRMIAPALEEIAAEHPEYIIGKVNVDEEMELTQQFGIVSIPALFVIKDGQVVNQAVGAMPKDKLLALLK